jgi:hypothetical protein
VRTKKEIQNRRQKVKTTIIFFIYYIILLGYLLTGIILRNWKSIAYAVLLGIIGIFIMHYIRDKQDTLGGEGLRIKDKRL